MRFRFKYKFLKKMIENLFDINVFNLNIDNNNTYININVDIIEEDSLYDYDFYVHVYEQHIIKQLNGDILNKLKELDIMFKLAHICEYLNYNDYFYIEDGFSQVGFQKEYVLKTPVIILGNNIYKLAVSLSEEFSDDDIESIVYALIKYSLETEYPEGELYISLWMDVYSRLNENMLDDFVYKII